MKMLMRSDVASLLALTTICMSLTCATAADLYIATGGNDTWSGRLAKANKQKNDGPFATLDRARDEIRKMKQAGPLPKGGVTVYLRGGVFQLDRAFALTAEDSGTEDEPVMYRAYKHEEVRIVGGKVLTGWGPASDPTVLDRLDPAVRDKMLQTDLKAQGITDYGGVVGGGPELFFHDRPMIVARWPNEGFVNIVDVVGGAPHRIHGIPGDKIGRFTYDGDRPKRWVGEKDLWLHGYWFWDWADQRQKVESIDTEQHVISLVPPYHWYGYRKGQWYYAFNALSELDSPEEWYLDRETGTLYFLPPAPIEQGKPMISILPTLVTMKNTEHVSLRGLIVEAGRATAITITGGSQNRVVGCTVRNVGSYAVQVSGGTANGVVGCDIYNTGDGGITLDGGDRKTLTPAGLYAENNHIHHYSRWNRICRPAISLGGVGNRATHNLIDNAPHQAIAFGGNDHLIEFNEIHSVCYESNDAGAIYAGRNWSMRGTVIRYNYFHHINGFQGRGCVGVYLDDQFSGTLVYGNVFYKVTRAAMIGGGRDCTIENNIFVDCVPATHVDARGLGWAGSGADGMKNSVLDMPYKTPPWSERYPQLLTLLDDEPMAPKGNLIARNICVRGKWGDFEAKAKPMVTFTDNLLDQDPLFVNEAKMNFQLKGRSPAYKMGFKRIPMEQIGLIKDDTRASWPVKHEVRAMVESPQPKAAATRTGPPPVFRVVKSATPVVADGTINPKEWNGADPTKAMVIEQGLEGEKVTPRSLAWMAYNDNALLIAVNNEVDSHTPVSRGSQWGQDDAVEIAIRNTAAGKDAPLLVLRGYPNGHFESSDEAGAPDAAAKRAAQGVEYKTKVVAGRWTCEWRIPFASLGIDPSKQSRFAFNLSVRKMAEPLWVLWQGTHAGTWEVGNAGFIELLEIICG